MASCLLKHLRLLGRRRGLPRLFAQVRRENKGMLAVFAHGGATLDACLRSVAASTTRSIEVIVVDDGSADDSARIAERAGARVLRLARRGRAAALNSGIADATGEVILFTDADCVVPVGWPAEDPPTTQRKPATQVTRWIDA